MELYSALISNYYDIYVIVYKSKMMQMYGSIMSFLSMLWLTLFMQFSNFTLMTILFTIF